MTTREQLKAFPGWDWGDGRNGIGWCDETVNPIRGCTPISAGCKNCYAEKFAGRLAKMPHMADVYGPLVVEKSNGVAWSGKLSFDIRQMDRLKGLKTRSRVFFDSMSDLFHEDAPDEWLDQIFAVIRRYPQHLFMVLTKRARRMAEYSIKRPFPANVWAGVSVENQETANERISWLAEVAGGGPDGSAPRTWLSYEPALGPVDLKAAFNSQWPTDDQGVRELGSDLVIAGGESGPDARPAHPDWFRSMRDQCDRLGIPYRHKQNGEWLPMIDRDRDDPEWRLNYMTGPKRCLLNLAGGSGFHGERVLLMERVSLQAAGRLLDDEEHLPLPPLPVTT